MAIRDEIDLMEMAQDASALLNITRIIDVPAESYYLLKPGELVLGMTFEKLTLPPDIAGSMEGRSRFARYGTDGACHCKLSAAGY